MVLGVSHDSTESHRNFIKKYDLKFDLLSDPKRQMMARYKAAENGRTIRSTVIIDPKGVAAHHFPKVNPRGHIDEVKKVLAELQKKRDK